jgi:hypothetical protein
MLYTMAVCLLTWQPSLLWVALVFCSHFVIDRFGVAEKYLALIGGRSVEKFLFRGHVGIQTKYPRQNYHALRAGFTAFVYGVTDNTMHLLLMWYAARLLRL